MEHARIEQYLKQSVSRAEAEQLLKHGDAANGTYLLRPSSTAGSLVLTMAHNKVGS
jgi:hypothetical protein